MIKGVAMYKKTGLGILGLTLLMTLGACSSPEKKILGKWQVDTSFIIEFFKDGTVTLSKKDEPPIIAHYNFLDKVRIRLEVNDSMGKKEWIWKISFDGDNMIIADPDGKEKTSTGKRMKA